MHVQATALIRLGSKLARSPITSGCMLTILSIVLTLRRAPNLGSKNLPQYFGLQQSEKSSQSPVKNLLLVLGIISWRE